MTSLDQMLPSGSVEMTTNSSVEMTTGDLGQANRRISQTLIPCMVVLGIFMLTGLVGNALTCYVFGCRLRRNTQHFFILMLAVFDMLSCSLGLPAEIADMALYYRFDSALVCKVTRFTNTFPAMCSILTLIAIAIDRFRRLHRPHQAQITVRNAHWSLLPILLLSLLLSWPALVIYGVRTVDTKVPGLKGKDCTIDDLVRDTIYPLIYNAFLFISFIGLAIALIVLYAKILKGLTEHSQKRKKQAHSDHPVSCENSSSTGTQQSTTETEVSPAQTGHLLDKTATQCDNRQRLQSERNIGQTGAVSAKIFQAVAHDDGVALENGDEPVLLAVIRRSNSPIASLPQDSTVSVTETPDDDCSLTTKINPQVAQSENKVDTAGLSTTTREGSHSDHHDVRASDDHHAAITETDQPKLTREGETDTQTDKGVSHRPEISNDSQDDQGGQSNYLRKHSTTPLVAASDLSSTDRSVIFQKESSALHTVEESTQNNDSLNTSKAVTKPSPSQENRDITKRITNPSLSQTQDENCIKLGRSVKKTSLSQENKQTTRPITKLSFAHENKNITKKTTIIFFLVTVVFLLSFVPHLCLQITLLIVKDFEEDLDDVGLPLYHLFLRSYFINSVANPIIYGVMNEQFRLELRSLAQRISCRG